MCSTTHLFFSFATMIWALSFFFNPRPSIILKNLGEDFCAEKPYQTWGVQKNSAVVAIVYPKRLCLLSSFVEISCWRISSSRLPDSELWRRSNQSYVNLKLRPRLQQAEKKSLRKWRDKFMTDSQKNHLTQTSNFFWLTFGSGEDTVDFGRLQKCAFAEGCKNPLQQKPTSHFVKSWNCWIRTGFP